MFPQYLCPSAAQIQEFADNAVDRSKIHAGEGRIIPINPGLFTILMDSLEQANLNMGGYNRNGASSVSDRHADRPSRIMRPLSSVNGTVSTLLLNLSQSQVIDSDWWTR